MFSAHSLVLTSIHVVYKTYWVKYLVTDVSCTEPKDAFDLMELYNFSAYFLSGLFTHRLVSHALAGT